MSLFQKSVEKKYLEELDSESIEKKYNEYISYFGNKDIQENIRNSKEEQFQEGFLRELFVKILGYRLNPEPSYNLTTELKNISNNKKVDGAILNEDSDAIAVIELKSTSTANLDSIEAQAFGYKNHQPKCLYVISSNFEKLRFYIEDAVDFIDFDLFNMEIEDFSLMWLCLSSNNLLKNIPLTIKEYSVVQEEDITKQLYHDYSAFRKAVFNNLVDSNPNYDKLLLFKKTQKLLDRFLFIFFAEDRLLLPPNYIRMIIDQWNRLKSEDEYFTLYSRFKKYFEYMNTGYEGSEFSVFAYNGGLFKPDEILDNIIIDDDVLLTHTKKLSSYNFDTDVDVNILGHIFEHSLVEIENIHSEINGQIYDDEKSKRKKDGIFYTPKYITQYIVNNSIGKLCQEKKSELQIIDEVYLKGRKNRKITIIKALDNKLASYREWLLNLSIIDPACGSGAFLNQALDFLIEEHKKVDFLDSQLHEENLGLHDIETQILERNIFGVDINEESVEIAKLSLWLRTAQRGRKLNSLSNNIKCGNSLISDPQIAGSKAFEWEKEFPDVFARGGFDIVIGNPPYGLDQSEINKVYYLNNYNLLEGRYDLFELFIERSLHLLNQEGTLSFIIPNTILSNLYTRKLRKFLVEQYRLEEITNFGIDVFEDPTVHTCIIRLSNKRIENYLIHIRKQVNAVLDLCLEYDYDIDNKNFLLSENQTYDIFFDPKEAKLFSKLNNFDKLGELCFIRQCIKTGNDKIYVSKSNQPLSEPWKKALRGKGMGRYSITESDLYLKYGDWLARNWKNKTFYETDKIIIRETGNRITATIDTENNYLLSSLYSIYPKTNFSITYLQSILAVLNSKLATYFIKKIAFELTKGAFTKVRTNQLARLPIPEIALENQNILSEYVLRIIQLHKSKNKIKMSFSNYLTTQISENELTNKLIHWDELSNTQFLSELTKTLKKNGKSKLSKIDEMEWLEIFEIKNSEIKAIHSEIEKVDGEIDQFIYKLYGLSKDEITIIEGN